MFDDLDPATMTQTDNLTDAQLGQALSYKKLITGWLDSVEQHITERLSAGEDFEGYKIVEGRSLRKWADETAAVEQLSQTYSDEQLYKKAFISVPQAEKLIGKKEAASLADLIIKPSGKPTLAPASDKRPAINLQENDFDAC